MRVLVSGGAGFIGSHIVDQLLARGHEPHVVDDLSSGSRENVPPSVPLSVLDVRNRESVARLFAEVKPEWVCHQAAQMSVSRSMQDPADDASINIMGLLNVLDESSKCGVKRVVFASSGGVLYGDVDKPADEDTPARPISPYGISKWVGEKYLEFYTQARGMQCVALRYSNVYGPRQNPHGEAGVVAIFCQKMLRGEAPTIHGDGEHVRDYVYCTDVARANILALEKTIPSGFVPLNVGTSKPTTTKELADTLYERCAEYQRKQGTGKSVPKPVHGPARAGDLLSSLVDAGKAERLLGWRPEVSIADGLGQTVEWFAQHTKP